MEPTYWTPKQGPARNALERVVHHVWRKRIAWYVSIVGAVSVAVQLSVGSR